jgi:hypothetical protein
LGVPSLLLPLLSSGRSSDWSGYSLHPSQRRTDEVIFLRQKKPQKGFSLLSLTLAKPLKIGIKKRINYFLKVVGKFQTTIIIPWIPWIKITRWRIAKTNRIWQNYKHLFIRNPGQAFTKILV